MAIGRALNRFVEEGRYIPPAILYEYGNAPSEVFKQIITGGSVDGGSHYDNDVERGSQQSSSADMTEAEKQRWRRVVEANDDLLTEVEMLLKEKQAREPPKENQPRKPL